MSDYSYLNRSELVQLLMNQKNELGKQLVKVEPKDENAKNTLNAYKVKLETEITAIEAKLKETVTTVAQSAGQTPTPDENDQTMIKSLQDQATVQNLLDVIKNVPKMVVGDSMETSVTKHVTCWGRRMP